VRCDPKIVAAFLEIQKTVAQIADGKSVKAGPAPDAIGIATNLLGMGMSLDDIITATGLARKDVERLRDARAE
jgi:hypothetical protein